MLDNADAIVMLTWSDWFKELRSNRYHYATRFAKIKPVIFVQPDLTESRYFFEETGIENIVVLHIPNTYDAIQEQLFNKALTERDCIQPIFWVYNCYFQSLLAKRYSLLNIFHGTEDYLASDSRIKFQDETLINAYLNTLSHCQLIITVSDGVQESFESNTNFDAKIASVYNGCDYSFYCPIKNQAASIPSSSKVAFYQGNIFDKLDYDLLLKLTKMLPDWTFNFCGKVLFNEKGWQQLCAQPNVNYLGLKTPEEIRTQSYLSTVGLIPFVQNEWLVERSFPLKTFEYLASGLPVVSIPIKNILNFSDVIQFAETVEEFAEQITRAAALRWDAEHLKMRLQVAAQQDYDIRFQQALEIIESTIAAQSNLDSKITIGILYEPSSVVVSTIEEHLSSFTLFSKHHISYIPATQDLQCSIDLNVFDVIVIHYSIRVSVRSSHFMLSAGYVNAVKAFGGYKIIFIQDEYEGTNIARSWIKELGIHSVYTCVPQQYKEMIYPSAEFSNVEFITNLTGYVPTVKSNRKKSSKTCARPILIGYRGRSLPFWYGSLGQDKLEIGIKVKDYCQSKNLPVDIEWVESKRIYGPDWYQFLMSCRATLGTESGANVFDFDGKIRADIEKKLISNPNLLFEDVYDEYIKSNEIIKMNQISPKVFEAIVFKTALILFEGEYSGVLIPNIHYLPLKKDFSNLDEIVEKIQSDELINKLTQIAYDDIIKSNQYSYAKFIADFDENLRSKIRPSNRNHKELYFLTYATDKKIGREHSLISATIPTNHALTLDEINQLQNGLDRKLRSEYKKVLWMLPAIFTDAVADSFKRGVLASLKIKPVRRALKLIPPPIKKVVKTLVHK